MNEPTLTLPFFNPSGAYPPSPSSPFSETFDNTLSNGSGSSSYPLGTLSNGLPSGQMNGRQGGNIQNMTLSNGITPGMSDVNGSTNGYGETDYTSFYDPSAYLQTSPTQAPQPLPQAGPSRPSSHSTSPNRMNGFQTPSNGLSQSWDGRQGDTMGNGFGGIEANQLYLPSRGMQELQTPQGDEAAEEELVDVDEGEDGSQAVDGEEEGQEDGQEMGDIEEPLYVNAKQYHRILKRRAARQRLDELNRLARSRKPYLHESRHRHACNRPRGKGGRFLTAEEIEALKKEEAAKGGT